MSDETNEQCEGCEAEVGDEPFYCHICETGVFCAGCWDGCECHEQIDDRFMLSDDTYESAQLQPADDTVKVTHEYVMIAQVNCDGGAEWVAYDIQVEYTIKAPNRAD